MPMSAKLLASICCDVTTSRRLPYCAICAGRVSSRPPVTTTSDTDGASAASAARAAPAPSARAAVVATSTSFPAARARIEWFIWSPWIGWSEARAQVAGLLSKVFCLALMSDGQSGSGLPVAGPLALMPGSITYSLWQAVQIR